MHKESKPSHGSTGGFLPKGSLGGLVQMEGGRASGQRSEPRLGTTREEVPPRRTGTAGALCGGSDPKGSRMLKEEVTQSPGV